MPSNRTLRTYEHRLIQLVQETGDAAIATRLGVPRPMFSVGSGARTTSSGDAYGTVAQTGLRRNEVTLVRIQDVDFDNGVIWLPLRVAKSKREQYVHLNSDIARRFRAYIRPLGDVDPASVLFPARRGTIQIGAVRSEGLE